MVCNACGARRLASTKPESSKAAQLDAHAHTHTHEHGHDHAHGGLFHAHVHDPSEGAGQLMDAFKKGRMDKGSRITIIGQC